VQVDPIKPTLKPPGSERLKVKCDEPLLNLAFEFNLRRYNKAVWGSFWQSGQWGYSCCRSFQKNSYCTGIRGIEAGSSHPWCPTQPLETQISIALISIILGSLDQKSR